MKAFIPLLVFLSSLSEGSFETLKKSRISDCLLDFKIVNPLDLFCYTPLEQNVCREGLWFVMNHLGEGSCQIRPCDLAEFFIGGKCKRRASACSGQGQTAFTNVEGNSYCRCKGGFGADPQRSEDDPECFLLHTQGFCHEDEVMVDAETALKFQGGDAICPQGSACVPRDECKLQTDENNLEETACNVDKTKVCCPDVINPDIMDFLKMRLKTFSPLESITCIKNHCSQDGDELYVPWRDGTCRRIEGGANTTKSCKTFLAILEDDDGPDDNERPLVCDPDLVVMTIAAGRRRKCPSGKTYNPYRKTFNPYSRKCVKRF